MNQPNHVISENLVISQPLYDNDQAAQSIYDKYLKDCALNPIRLIEESQEIQERPFAGTRQNSQQYQNQRNGQNIQDYNSLERDQRNRFQQQMQQVNYQQDQQYQHYHNNYQRYPNYNIYYHQGQYNQFQNYNHERIHHQQNRRNHQNYRMGQEYYLHQMRRQEEEMRRKHHQQKYALDQDEIASLSEIIYRQSKASCWEDENKKCSICISHFEENEKIRFLPCLHRYNYQFIFDFIQVVLILGWPLKDLVLYVKSMLGPQFNNSHEINSIYYFYNDFDNINYRFINY